MSMTMIAYSLNIVYPPIDDNLAAERTMPHLSVQTVRTTSGGYSYYQLSLTQILGLSILIQVM